MLRNEFSLSVLVEEGKSKLRTPFERRFKSMANLIALALSITLLLVSIDGSIGGRCARLEHAKRSFRQHGDGGYRIFIDGDPMGYQPGKIYNG